MDAAIVYSCRRDADALGWLRRRGLPLVQVDQPVDPELSSVNVEDRAGARAAAQHVVDLGHRTVAVVVAGPDTVDDSSQHQRLLGWHDALDPAGVQPILLRCAASAEEQGFAAVRELLAGPDRPTALLCFSDALAAGAMRAARVAGLDVPTELTVVGFDDSPLARRTDPPLTTVRQDPLEKGRAAAVTVVETLDRRRQGRPAEVRQLMLPTELVIRDSSAPPPGSLRG